MAVIPGASLHLPALPIKGLRTPKFGGKGWGAGAHTPASRSPGQVLSALPLAGSQASLVSSYISLSSCFSLFPCVWFYFYFSLLSFFAMYPEVIYFHSWSTEAQTAGIMKVTQPGNDPK